MEDTLLEPSAAISQTPRCGARMRILHPAWHSSLRRRPRQRADATSWKTRYCYTLVLSFVLQRVWDQSYRAALLVRRHAVRGVTQMTLLYKNIECVDPQGNRGVGLDDQAATSRLYSVESLYGSLLMRWIL